MSGAEALVVLGILANVAGVADATIKILKRIKEASANVNDLPKAFRDIEVALPLLLKALDRTRDEAESGALDEDNCVQAQALRPVLDNCFTRIDELRCIFEGCLPKGGEKSSKLARGWKAVTSMRLNKKVEEYSELLRRDIQLLTFYHVANSSKNVESTKTGVANLTVASAEEPKIYYELPIHWSNDFIGREEQMLSMNEKLCQNGRHCRVALVGLGGMGKTRLALQFVNQYRKSNTSIYWIHAGTAERMRGASREIAKKVGVLGWDDPHLDVLTVLKEWFESPASGNWLVVYDNADDVDLLYADDHGRLAAFFPRSNAGSILLTTRNRQIGVKFATSKNTIAVSALNHAESSTLIEARLGSNESESDDRVRLAEVLCGIPLAMVQAISFIEENGLTTMNRYLELYHASDTSRIQLLSRDFEDDTRDSQENPVASTWMVTFEYMKKHYTLAARILCRMSMYDAQAIPEALISNARNASPVDHENALGTLQAYSLISPRPASATTIDCVGRLFDLHPLVRLVTRSWLMSCHNWDGFVAKAIDKLSIAYDRISDVSVREFTEVNARYLSHALALIASPPLNLHSDDVTIPPIFRGQTMQNNHAEEGRICPSCTANILSSIDIDDQSRELVVKRKAVAISSQTFGPNHSKTLDLRCLEAISLYGMNDWAASERAYRDVLEGYIAILGPCHLRSSLCQVYLGKSLENQCKYAEAERVSLQLIEAHKHNDGGEEVGWVTEAMQTLLRIFIKQGRVQETDDMSLTISKRTKGPWSTYELAKSCMMQSQYLQAEQLSLSLLDDKNILLSNRVIGIDSIQRLLGIIYKKTQRYEESEDVLLQALSYAESAYGEHHADTLLIKLELAATYASQRRYEASETLLLPTIANLQRHWGDLNDTVLLARLSLASTWYDQKRYDEAEALALEVTNLTIKARGQQHETSIERVRSLKKYYGVNPDGTLISESSVDHNSEPSWEVVDA